MVPVTGLAGSNLVGISFRPAGGQLYGVGIGGDTESVFGIDLSGGAASPVGSATQPTIGGAPSYGVDFNPVSDRLRVVSGLESGVGTNINNFRVNPSNAAIAGVDTDLSYSALPGGEGANRPLATIAYDRNVLGATASTVVGLTVAANDSLVRLGGVDGLPSPNGGALTQIGPLGVDTSSNAGLDIDPATGEAYAILQSPGRPASTRSTWQLGPQRWSGSRRRHDRLQQPRDRPAGGGEPGGSPDVCPHRHQSHHRAARPPPACSRWRSSRTPSFPPRAAARSPRPKSRVAPRSATRSRRPRR